MDASVLPECTDAISGQNTMEVAFEKILFTLDEEWLRNCPMPCNQTVFELNLQKFHKHNMPVSYKDQTGTTGVAFLLKYESLVIEEHEETLVYNTANFLAQTGGNLGLFLGFSCLSLLLG